MKGRTRPRGFTLVELLIVTVLGTVVLLATLSILVSNQQTLTAVATKLRVYRTLRSGMGILAGELREISPATGDLLVMGDDSVEVRVTRSFGLVCAITGGPNPQLTVKTVGEPFAPNDSIFLLAANDPGILADDVWKIGTVNNIVSTTTCNGSDTAQVLTVGGMTVGSPPDSVSVGAPMRAFLHYIYGLFMIDGQAYVARELSGTTVTPTSTAAAMVGPLRRVSGVPTFTYWDPFGNAAIIPSQVARIRMVLRTVAEIPGGVVRDSIVLDIHPRN
jgi:prepilin-type N-terminal cleavage/methylation domain-containing protein